MPPTGSMRQRPSADLIGAKEPSMTDTPTLTTPNDPGTAVRHADAAQDQGCAGHGAKSGREAEAGHAHGHGANRWVTSAHATLHCLSGCVIGEVAGLAIGVSLGWPVWATITLATVLAYISGFTLGLVPVMRQTGRTFVQAFKAIWLGEAISIGVMEIAMNSADVMVGGASAGSILEPAFLIGLAVAIPAGFLAAWPVNAWLLARDMKNCH
ncbi:hypothetical protein CCR85_09375 [Rhodothalassium salexigens]|nr:hypothetical protein [Rhodothalassium salexigens]MBK5919715.1 hypothetical protein [Rhodothalassium salexigens]